MDALNIREAKEYDFANIAALCDQLGYPTESEAIPERLDQIRNLEHHAVFVAELDHRVIGWIHVYICPLLVSPLQAQLGGLVVDSNQRGKGIGTKLLQQAESWSHAHDCQYLTIYTNITRTDTHHFYDNQGYKSIKTEYVLRKKF